MPKKKLPTTLPEQPSDRTPEQSRLALKKKVRMFYDLQRLRLQCAGRTLARPSKPDSDGEEKVQIALHEVDLIILEARAKELSNAEKNALDDVAEHLKTMPFYVKVLSDKERFRGIGPTMAGVILAEIDFARQDTPSKTWAFAGLRPMPAMRCKMCHRVLTSTPEGYFVHVKERPRGKSSDTETKMPKCPKAQSAIRNSDVYESGKAQRPVKGEQLSYNAFLRTKLVGVLADVMIKLGSPWRKHYDDYKHRKQTAGWGVSDGHRHNAAKRYMIKMLLQEIWREWRTFHGMPVRDPYPVEFQGKSPHVGGLAGPSPAVTFEEDPEVKAEIETWRQHDS